ncbi:MAG: Hsp33 family molecular chaperone HslO [Myxococcales bacterium]|nr:Hsp33 family molecular chaperone HslO [Myxococcales bacterium]
MSDSPSGPKPVAPTHSAADSVVRAITDDGSFRVITASTTHTVRGACVAQGTTGRTTEYLSDMLTGAVLFRETMAPSLRVQAILSGSGSTGRIVADSHPSGDTRGLVQLGKAKTELALGDGARIQVMRSLSSGKLQQGVVDASSDGGISTAYMAYMQNSEQVVSMIALDTILDDNQVVAAGGYMVQLLPEVGRAPLAVMTERLEDFRSIAAQIAQPDFTPDQLLSELLYGMPFTRLEESEVRFNCWCSEASMMGALASLPHPDIEDLVKDGEVLEIQCDYCRTEYKVAPERLRGMLAEN